jgi:hypothetical protein
MKAAETGRDRYGGIGNDAALSMSFVRARTVVGGRSYQRHWGNHFDDGKPKNIMAKQLHHGATARVFH